MTKVYWFTGLSGAGNNINKST